MYEVGSMPPNGYIAWDEWASVQIRGGLKQSQCTYCKLWLFPQEFKSHECRRILQDWVCDRCGHNATSQYCSNCNLPFPPRR